MNNDAAFDATSVLGCQALLEVHRALAVRQCILAPRAVLAWVLGRSPRPPKTQPKKDDLTMTGPVVSS